ncbi:MAG: hypothetical protein LUC60_03705 [Lachnospiraceae bacterium]|nr:hypothetical protein [Lachnospiraceae bacterium]
MRKSVSGRSLLLLFSGLLAGIVLVQIQKEARFSGIFSEYFLNQYASLRIDTGKLLVYTGRCHMGQYLLLVCLGCLSAAQATLCILLFGMGMLLGTVLSISALRLGLEGILICAVGVLPQLFFYIPAFGWVFFWVWRGGRSRRKYLFLSVAGSLFLIFGILAEVYINPPLLQQLLRRM